MDRYKIRSADVAGYQVIPMIGGMVTVRERPTIEFGHKSLVQNMRCWQPGFETRKGYSKHNSTAYNASSNSPLNMYQFRKGKNVERHFLVQFGNNNLLEATNDPPSTGTTFGSVIHAGSSGQIPASFTDVNDYLVYSNGADQHQIYAGEDQDIEAFIVVKDTGAHDHFPDIGEDYTFDVRDSSSSGVAVLDSLGDYATDYDAIYIMTKTPIDLLYFAVSAANGTSADLKLDIWTNSGWSNEAITDNTATGGATFAQSGTVVVTDNAASRTDEIPRMMFNQTGYWYKLYLDNGDSLDAEVEISHVNYDCTTFIPLVNIWNGVETDLVESFVYINADTAYYNYSTAAITVGDLTSSDIIYVASAYPLEGIYFDFGTTINTTGADPTISYWDGSSWQATTEKVDGTNEFLESGWCIFARPTDEQPRQFKNTKYYAYWYKIVVDATIDSSVTMSVLGMPYFDINELGSVGNVCGTWKNRALYTFNKFPRDIYVSESGEHMKLNGSDYAILQPGDGRDNATKAIVKFHNEIMVFQEEVGKDGGCVTIFEGYSPATFGKLVLSTKIGTFSAKSVDVVDGSKSSSTKRDLNAQTQAFFLSHYGVFMSDGRIVTCISDDIQNYFDPRFSECIRAGYEDEMWLSWDTTENMIKIGIVSGSSATTCNKFFCYDLASGQWYEDTYADSLSVFSEVEGASGQFHALQVAAGSTTGFVYRMNSGTNDDGDDITWKIVWEFSNGPFFINLEEVLVRLKVQGADTSYSWTAEENDKQEDSGTGSMVTEIAGYTLRRNRHQQKVGNIPWISFTMTGTDAAYLYDMAVIATTDRNK